MKMKMKILGLFPIQNEKRKINLGAILKKN